MGGAVKALEAGFIQREIGEAAYIAQQQLDSGDQVVVGVNRFRDTSEETGAVAFQALDPKQEQRQVQRTQRVRAQRDGSQAEQALGRLEDEARGDGNLLEPILEAVEAYATLGEIAESMRRVFGGHQQFMTGF